MPVGRTLVVVTIAILCSTLSALAQTIAAGQILYSEGSVSLQSRGHGEWIKVGPGTTVSIADNLWADQNSRTELLLAGDIVRLNSQTSFTIESASEDRLDLKLWLGSIFVANVGDRSRRIRIETPNLLFALEEPGEYRLDVNAPGDETVATVWQGRGEATGGGARYFVHATQRAALRGTDDLQITLDPVLRADDFDQWALNRDQSLEPGESRRAANDSTRSTDPDQSAGTPEEEDDRELGPDGPGTVALRCPTPWCEVVEAYPTPWIWPPWWGPYPDPWVLTASVPRSTRQTGAVAWTEVRRPLASAKPRPDVARSNLQSLPPPPSTRPVPARVRTAEGGSSEPPNPRRNPGSTDARSHSQPTTSDRRDSGSASRDRPSPTTAGDPKTRH